MKKFLFLCAALTLGASAAYAAIDLSWDGCNPGVATSDKVFSCDGTGFYETFGTVVPSVPVTNFIGIQGQIDIQSEGGPIPEFWAFELGAPNNSVFGYVDARGTSTLACNALTTMWGNTGTGGTDVFQYDRGATSPRGMPLNRALIQFADARLTPIATLNAGTNYYAFTLNFDEASAVDLTGCSSPVAMVLNEIELASTTNVAVEEQAPGLRGNCATVNGAGPASCAATPVKNRTWGSVKSLYR